MLYCLNPNCNNPKNEDDNRYCQNCSTLLIPSLRNRYRIISILSDEGGFSRTYLAEDADKLNELCVVKQFAPKVREPSALQKAIELFKEEAKRLQQLGEHNQIPTLFAYFEENVYLFLVQQYIEGQNLRREVEQKGTFSESEILQFLLDLLPVLNFIHARGVIHRDIKPQNIIRRQSDGRIVLIDFGASKLLTTTIQTKMGTIIGSHGYTPIEQMEYGQASPASDLFSLGVTCFFLLTGIYPSKIRMQQGYGWVGLWRQYLKKPVNAELVRILDRLMKENISERYQSTDEVYSDLMDLTDQYSSPLPLPPTIQSIPPRRGIKLNYQLLLIAAIVVLGLGLVGYLQYLAKQEEPVTKISDRHQPSNRMPDTDPTIKPSINENLPENLRGHSSDVNSVAFNLDGSILASGSDDKTIKLWSLSSKQNIGTLTGHKEYIYSVAFAPDSKTLASGGYDKTIILWDIQSKEQIATLKGHQGSVTSVAISPDGNTLASGSLDGTIRLWDIASKQQINTPLKGHSRPVSSIAMSPDGNILASGSYDNTIILWNLASKQKIATLSGHIDSVISIAISPDGITLASGSQDKTIQLWNLLTQQKIQTLIGHSDKVNSIAFSPDGKKLVSGSHDNTIMLWNVETGRKLNTLKRDFGNIYSVAFSSDGKTIASGGNTENILKIWQVLQSETPTPNP